MSSMLGGKKLRQKIDRPLYRLTVKFPNRCVLLKKGLDRYVDCNLLSRIELELLDGARRPGSRCEFDVRLQIHQFAHGRSLPERFGCWHSQAYPAGTGRPT